MIQTALEKRTIYMQNIFDIIKEQNIEFIDFRFTDTKGKWQHTSMYAEAVDVDLLQNGIMFDGSSISGWKGINESDMILMPDLTSAVVDSFAAQPTLIIFCDVIEPNDMQGYIKDPRSTARRAEEYLKSTGIGDKAFFGPELEFFLFEDARFDVSMNGCFAHVDTQEGPYNGGTKYDGGNMGHRPKAKGGYFPVPPVDSTSDIRAEMLSEMKHFGLTPLLHHHEVAPGQCELGFGFGTLLETADNVQKYKYVVHNIAASYGLSATFMPKPIKGDNGSGMHTHQSIWKGDTPLFAGDGYSGLSETCLYYIGGIIKHAKALNAFTNASTNSYKRLVPGFEAPVLLAYSARNRSASIRVPYTASPKGKRIEARFPDPTANPYLAFSAMLMAGLDGIKNKTHPGEAKDKNLYDLDKEQLRDIPKVSSSLRNALTALDGDRDFLKEGGVFSDELIDAYIALKMEEVEDIEHSPHPIEFINYYSV